MGLTETQHHVVVSNITEYHASLPILTVYYKPNV